jgi:hypothetical protein
MKTEKNALIVLIAVAISTVSCVDNLVSPQVEAIRTQQVEWMKAKTASVIALNDLQTAANAYAVASNTILLKEKELTYTEAVAQNTTNLKNAELALATAKANLQTALNTLAVSVAASGDYQAQEYLRNYSIEADNLANLTSSRLGIQNSLVASQLVLSSPNVLGDFLKSTQALIDADVITLAAENATLVIFSNAVTANSTTSLTTERSTLQSTNSVVTARVLNLTYNRDKLEIQKNPLLAEKIVLENERSTYNSPADNAKIAAVNVKIDALIAKIAPLTVSINTLNTSIVADNAILSTNNLLISKLTTAITKIGENSSQLKVFIVSAETKITTLKASILSNQEFMLVNDTTKAIKAAEANVVLQTKNLTTANVNIIAQEKIVAYWKGLLDKIFTV